MKIRCQAPDFAQALRKIQQTGWSSKRDVWLLGLDDRTELVARGHEHTVRVSFDGDIISPGKTSFPLGPVAQWFRKNNRTTLDIVGEKSSASFEDKFSFLRIIPQGADEFVPSWLPDLPPSQVAFMQQPLRDAIRKVITSVSSDDKRLALTGVLWDVSRHGIALSATDNYRLAIANVQQARPEEGFGRYLVPGAAMKSTLQLLEQSPDATADAFFSSDVFCIRIGNPVADDAPVTWVAAHCIPLSFPDYSKVESLPTSEPIRVRQSALVLAMKKFAAFADLSVLLTLQDHTLSLSTYDAGALDARHRLDIDYSGPSMAVAFNPRFLLPGIQASTGPYVRVQLEGLGRPSVIADDDGSFRYYLMPVGLGTESDATPPRGD